MFETEPALPTDRLVEALSGSAGGSGARCRKALRRLRAILEENRDRGARATVGGRARLRRRCAAPPLVARRSWRSSPRGAGCGDKEEDHYAETEGLYLDVGALNYQVQMLALAEPARRRGPRVPHRPAGGHAAARRGRDVVRRLPARRERDGRGAAPDGRRLRDRRHPGEHLPAGRRSTRRPTRSSTSRSTSRPKTSLPLRDRPPARAPIQGRAAALQDQDRLASRTARSS